MLPAGKEGGGGWWSGCGRSASASPIWSTRVSAFPAQEVVMREKKGGALSKVQKLKRRISNSFGKLGLRRKRAISKNEVFEPEYRMPAISKSEDFEENGFRVSAISKNDDESLSVSGMKINGFSDEYLDRIEPNGNIPDKDCGWERLVDHREPLSRQLSVSSDSKLLDEDIRSEQKVIMRPKRPPRPKSEVYLCKDTRKSKRFSAFGVSVECPVFGGLYPTT
ncbi:uncharacterized protein [Procambarus clarkii]|uniref:uncharacterized protein n=1 Tax=Procambarus clarkii TaxID=6728 RepID=UPI0037435112